jgi:hypothetical protein
VKRQVAATAVTAAVLSWLVQSEVRRALRQRRDRKRVESLLRAELKAHSWLGEGLSMAVARLAPEEAPVSLTVTARGPDGTFRAYMAKQGDGAISVTTGRRQR